MPSTLARFAPWSLLVLLACADSSAHGELTRQDCANGEDDDLDGVADCFDPDCQLFEHCRLGAGAGQGSTAGGGATLPDAGVPLRDAAPPPLLVDSGAGCPQLPCAADQACIGGVCTPGQAVAGDQWIITSIEASVPRSIEYSAAAPTCIDDDCATSVSSALFQLCGCLPDPLVRVSVDGVEVGQTEPAVNVENVHWDTAISIVVVADSQLRFDVIDRDTFDDELVYDCSANADPGALATGAIACWQTFTTDTVETPFGVVASVRAPAGP